MLGENGEVLVRADTPAGRNFGSVISQLLNGSPDESQRIKLRLLYFVKHLQELAKFKPSALEKFRSRIRATGDDVANFYGTMFEVEIGASLARKELSFKEGECPDFEVEFGKETVGVECTIGRIEGEGLPLKKIEGRVLKKGEKSYMDLSGAVFVDGTAVYRTAAAGTEEEARSLGDKKIIMSKAVRNVDVGSAVLFFRVVHDHGRIETIYSRVDHPNIPDSLENFLDKAYPFGVREPDPNTISFLDQEGITGVDGQDD